MKITINIPKLVFGIGAVLALLGGMADDYNRPWANLIVCAIGFALMELVDWATREKQKKKARDDA